MDVEKIQRNMAFAASFATALMKLRDAEQQDQGAVLDADEVAAVIKGLRILRTPQDPVPAHPGH